MVLTQCQNVLRGDRLMVDMTTGVSRVESDSGRVQGLFIQSQGGANGKCGTPVAPGAARLCNCPVQVSKSKFRAISMLGSDAPDPRLKLARRDCI